MKKVTINFPSIVDSPETNDIVVIKEAFQSIGIPAMLSHIGNTNRLIQNGDIWFINDTLTDDGLGFTMTFILDSDEALASFTNDSLPGWSAMGGDEPVIEEMSFEEFATFASENEETAFDPYVEFNLARM